MFYIFSARVRRWTHLPLPWGAAPATTHRPLSRMRLCDNLRARWKLLLAMDRFVLRLVSLLPLLWSAQHCWGAIVELNKFRDKSSGGAGTVVDVTFAADGHWSPRSAASEQARTKVRHLQLCVLVCICVRACVCVVRRGRGIQVDSRTSTELTSSTTATAGAPSTMLAAPVRYGETYAVVCA